MKKLRISKIWIAVVVIVIVAVAAWAMSGGKKEEDIKKWKSICKSKIHEAYSDYMKEKK